MPRSPEPRVPRRRFLKTVGLIGLSSAVVPASLPLAQTAAPPPAGGARPDSTQAPAAPAEPGEDAKALAAIIQRRYGQQLSREQLDSITRDFDGDLKAGKRLRDFTLANGDEPDFTFHA